MNNLKIESHGLTLVDQVEIKLLEFLKENKINVGDSIPKEQDLAISLGVARSVLREALSRLKMVGMIESRTRRGMILCEPSLLTGLKLAANPYILGEDKVFDILDLRVAIEIGISSDILYHITNEDIKELEQIVKVGEVFENNEYTPTSEFSFHAKLYRISKNNTILEFQEIIHPVMDFVKHKFKDLIAPINIELKSKGLIVTHQDLLELLRDHKEEEFKKAIEKHFAVYKLLEQRKNIL